jgi:hypothetical protein
MLRPILLTEEECTQLSILVAEYNKSVILDIKVTVNFPWHELIYNKDFLFILFREHVRLLRDGIAIPYYQYVLRHISDYGDGKKITFVYNEYFNPSYTKDYTVTNKKDK